MTLVQELEARRDEAWPRWQVDVEHPELPRYAIWLQPFGYDLIWDSALWGSVLRCPESEPAVNFSDERVVHEGGHALDEWVTHYRAGGQEQAYAGLAAAHNDPTLATHTFRREIFAELFAASLIPNYVWQYPSLPSPQVFLGHVAERAFFRTLREERWTLARMAPVVVPAQLDSQGNTGPNGVVVGVTGLQPGIDAIGIATRVGFGGSEPTIGDTLFATDTASQTFGKLHVRGGSPKNGVAFYSVSAYQ